MVTLKPPGPPAWVHNISFPLCHVADGGYQFADGGHQFADGGYEFADGGYEFADGGYEFADGGYQFADGGKLSVIILMFIS